MRSCIRSLQRLSMRRLISLCILLSVCALLLPLPVVFLRPTGTEKDLSQPFPCQNRPCGCQSAEQCWKKCCCFTNTQKVAWAKTNKVKLPAYVLAAARKEDQSLGAKATEIKTPRCEHCVARKTVTPPVARLEVTKQAVAESVQSNRNGGTRVSAAAKSLPAHKSPTGSKWVMTVFAAQCQGQPTFWCCLPPTVLPTPAELIVGPSGLRESVVTESDRLATSSQRPPLPPPKIG